MDSEHIIKGNIFKSSKTNTTGSVEVITKGSPDENIKALVEENVNENIEHNPEFKSGIDPCGLVKIEVVLSLLKDLKIIYQIWFHPPLPTIDLAMEYWKDLPGTHCKNLFFRNHKGNRHYLVIYECSNILDIHSLERSLKEGKLSFASDSRMEKYLGVSPGSVSPFGLINDRERHIRLFIDETLREAGQLSFHPNDNRATIVIKGEDLFRFLDYCGNVYQFLSFAKVPHITF
ncbi:MAG: prolyl-tRNA editing protein [Bacteroidetes bacterium HGW-Bacteroidetes-8]|jgi:Ala-tRNA(Pro) deacylase|nr:MAG: prolyl-tRNA editing protein [Bacteroidetes bacterium HGW-Bacteroidetes-8]